VKTSTHNLTLSKDAARYVVEYADETGAVSYFVRPRSRKPGTKFRTDRCNKATRLGQYEAQTIASRCNGAGLARTARAVEVQ